MSGVKTLLPPPPHALFDTSDGSSVPEVSESKITLTSTPTAVITEDAEPIYVNERRDTIEAPPLVAESLRPPPSPPAAVVVSTENAGPTSRVAITWSLDNPSTEARTSEVEPAAQATTDGVAIAAEPASDATVPTTIPVAASTVPDGATVASDPASDATVPTPAAVATPRRARTAADQIARQRGVTPIRVPSVSKRYEAVRPAVLATARGPSRRFVIGASAAAGVCVFAAIGAIAWARSAASDTERVDATVAAATDQPPAAPAPAPAPAPMPAATPAPIDEPALAAPAVCSIRVEANTKGAALSVNGVRHGTAPAVVQAPCNTDATIELRHPRYEAFRQVIAVNEDVEFVATLEREKTALTLWSEPAGAEVTYNGVVLGKTPLVAKVPRYEQATVWFRAPGHTPDWRRITPKSKRKTVSITLKGMLLMPPS